jgi:hypothetical protein
LRITHYASRITFHASVRVYCTRCCADVKRWRARLNEAVVTVRNSVAISERPTGATKTDLIEAFRPTYGSQEAKILR